MTSLAPRQSAEHHSECKCSHAEYAKQLKAIADSLRLDIVRVMACGSFGVLELCRLFEIKQSAMSHHLKVLAQAGWVDSRREGNSIFYRRNYLASGHPQQALQQQLFDSLDAQPLAADIRAGIDAIQAERGQLSQRFFADNADKFREQQDLIASYPLYGDQVVELLRQTPLPNRTRALELGPGEGELLQPLAAQFEQVVALDNSQAMLERSRASAAGLDNIEFILGDTASLAELAPFDLIVANMVLHHTPNPREIFAELARQLTPGGALLITDLCRHDQNWVRDACGDLWQGFEPQDFNHWADTSGLTEGRSIFFALRNGFEIQIRQFFNPQSSASRQAR